MLIIFFLSKLSYWKQIPLKLILLLLLSLWKTVLTIFFLKFLLINFIKNRFFLTTTLFPLFYLFIFLTHVWSYFYFNIFTFIIFFFNFFNFVLLLICQNIFLSNSTKSEPNGTEIKTFKVSGNGLKLRCNIVSILLAFWRPHIQRNEFSARNLVWNISPGNYGLLIGRSHAKQSDCQPSSDCCNYSRSH